MISRLGYFAANKRRGAAGPGGDPFFDNVVFLMGFEDPIIDGFVYVSDQSNQGNDMAFNRADCVRADAAIFGGYGFRRGTLFAQDDIADDGDFSFGSDPFTIEFWMNASASVSSDYAIAKYVISGNQRSWRFEFGVSGPLSLRWSPNGSTQYTLTVVSTIFDGNDHHIAVDRDITGKLRLYVDGNMDASATANTAFFNSSAPFRIEAEDGNLALDEIRITKGVARYASDAGFTPPASAFPRS